MRVFLYRIILFGLQIDKLKFFYMDNFQLSVIEEVKDEWVVLKAGQFEIAFHKIGHSFMTEGAEKFTAETNTKLVFSIEENLEAFREKLIDNGVSMKEIKSFAGIDSLFCDGTDIEGNVFQLEQKLANPGF